MKCYCREVCCQKVLLPGSVTAGKYCSREVCCQKVLLPGSVTAGKYCSRKVCCREVLLSGSLLPGNIAFGKSAAGKYCFREACCQKVLLPGSLPPGKYLSRNPDECPGINCPAVFSGVLFIIHPETRENYPDLMRDFSACRSACQPFTAPTMAPFTKYFCTKG